MRVPEPHKDDELEGGWKATRWWALTDANDVLKAETSNPEEIVRFYEPGDKVFRVYHRTQSKSVEVDILDYYPKEKFDKIKADWAEIEKEMEDG